MQPPSLWLDRPPTRDRSRVEPPATSRRSLRDGAGTGQGSRGEAAAEAAGRLRSSIIRRRLVAGAIAGGLLCLAAVQAERASDGPDSLSISSGPLVSPGRGPASDVGRVYDAASPAVVSVRVGSASGTGFLINRNGIIVTNAHVVADSDQAEVSFGDRGATVPADVLGRDPSSDLSALRVDPGAAERVRPLPLADSDAVRVGDRVIAIGYPLSLDRTATTGIVSGVGREIQAPNGFQIDEVIQTDAPINPGNSGGPLLDERGRVIGVNSQIATAGARGNIGIGFAVPSNAVREVVPRLARGERIVRPYLGLTTTPAPGVGARIEEVVAGGPAAAAGLRAGPNGDVVVGVDGRTVVEPDDISRAIAGKSPGERVEVEIVRGGQRRTIEVELGTRPERVP
jgi:putative serine protease PepD